MSAATAWAGEGSDLVLDLDPDLDLDLVGQQHPPCHPRESPLEPLGAVVRNPVEPRPPPAAESGPLPVCIRWRWALVGVEQQTEGTGYWEQLKKREHGAGSLGTDMAPQVTSRHAVFL